MKRSPVGIVTPSCFPIDAALSACRASFAISAVAARGLTILGVWTLLLTSGSLLSPNNAMAQTEVDALSHSSTSPLWCTWTAPSDADLPGTGKTIVLVSGDEEYRSEEALPMLGKLLSHRFGFQCHCLFAIDPDSGVIDPNNQQNIPGLHLLKDADLVILALRFRNLPDDQMKHFVEYFESGKPLIGLRTSTHAFNYPGDSESAYRHFSFNSRQWPGGFGRQVLGETWVNHHGHHGQQATRGIPHPDAEGHPMMTDVEDVWGPTDVYGIRDLPEGTTVLLDGQVLDGMSTDSAPVTGSQNDPMMPLAWTRDYVHDDGTRNRIMCTTMGAATDFESPGLRRLIVNTSLVLTGAESSVDDVTSVAPVGDYDPTDFGFNKFVEGRRPADYQ